MAIEGAPRPEDIALFKQLLDENRYDFCKLVFIIFPFGQVGHPLEFKRPYDWQMEEWAKLSKHLSNPATRYDSYWLEVSSGNGAAKTAFGAMTFFMIMYTQQVRARITANTQPQMKSVVWPEYDIWFQHARFHDYFFEKLGESIKAREKTLAETWRLDAVTWDEGSPASMSGLHNEGKATMYIFEEAPGIPAVIWKYASGAFTEKNTIKLWLAFGNSDDPESKFEQNMSAPDWRSRRIDTRTMKHVDPKQIAIWLRECGGNEDHDDFRVRVRGLPRKTAKDSIIMLEAVQEAFERGRKYDLSGSSAIPVILTCDPAWQGGDETVIAMRQGSYIKVLEKFKLDKTQGQDHMFTYVKLTSWERKVQADAVFIDQGEGTALKTIANMNGKHHWELVAFSNSPNDKADVKESEYGNIRAQMYYETGKFLMNGGMLAAEDPLYEAQMEKQLCWTKGTRHKVTGKKMCESKIDIKARVGASPDIADAIVLCFAREVNERLPEHDPTFGGDHSTGSKAYKMPDHEMNYDDGVQDAEYYDVYN